MRRRVAEDVEAKRRAEEAERQPVVDVAEEEMARRRAEEEAWRVLAEMEKQARAKLLEDEEAWRRSVEEENQRLRAEQEEIEQKAAELYAKAEAQPWVQADGGSSDDSSDSQDDFDELLHSFVKSASGTLRGFADADAIVSETTWG
mmetsp:Transcript_89336/g.191628  ORF Transcript_89336/g.191628 Transcript_89336/m.191628 type:complete len:146 (+) Transcript_89336:2-439(+)